MHYMNCYIYESTSLLREPKWQDRPAIRLNMTYLMAGKTMKMQLPIIPFLCQNFSTYIKPSMRLTYTQTQAHLMSAFLSKLCSKFHVPNVLRQHISEECDSHATLIPQCIILATLIYHDVMNTVSIHLSDMWNNFSLLFH